MTEKDLMEKALSAYGLDRQAICRAAQCAGAARLPKGEPDMKKRKLPVAIAVVLAAACLGGGVYAAGVLMNASQAAEAMGESDVAALFEGDEAVAVNETQSDAGYDVTLLGLVTGEHLTENWNSSWGDDGPENGTTYAVVAVRKSDGTPMPEVTDAADDFYPSETFAQPVLAIPELDPMAYTLHVETVVLLSKLNTKQHIDVELNLDELDLTAAESKATYDEIKAYVLEKHGLKVSSLYISQVKRKCGLDVGQNYNLSKKENAKVPQCPPEKEAAIMEALKHFQMI